MIDGIGTDLCEILRMEALLDKESFLDRWFTPGEKAYIKSKGKGGAASMAAIFAAKEAAAKALGTGFRGFGPGDIEVSHDELGCPSLTLHGAALETARSRGIGSLQLSLSHDGGLALAFVIAETAEGET